MSCNSTYVLANIGKSQHSTRFHGLRIWWKSLTDEQWTIKCVLILVAHCVRLSVHILSALLAHVLSPLDKGAIAWSGSMKELDPLRTDLLTAHHCRKKRSWWGYSCCECNRCRVPQRYSEVKSGIQSLWLTLVPSGRPRFRSERSFYITTMSGGFVKSSP